MKKSFISKVKKVSFFPMYFSWSELLTFKHYIVRYMSVFKLLYF